MSRASTQLTFDQFKYYKESHGFAPRGIKEWTILYKLYLDGYDPLSKFVFDEMAQKTYQREVDKIIQEQKEKLEAQIREGDKKRPRESGAEPGWFEVHQTGFWGDMEKLFKQAQAEGKLPNDADDLKHIKKVNGKFVCADEDFHEAYKNCYYEWWTEEMMDDFIAKWKRKYPYTQEQFFRALNSNSGYPWAAINADLGIPPNPREKSAATDAYYEYLMPKSGVIYEWYQTYGSKFGIDQRAQLDRKFSYVKVLADEFHLQYRDFTESVNDASDKAAPYVKYLYALAVLLLISGGLGSGAYLVHEIKK